MGDETRGRRQKGRHIDGHRRGRDTHAGCRRDPHAEHSGDGASGSKNTADGTLGGRRTRVCEAQARLDREHLVEGQGADVSQACHVVSGRAISLEDARAAHRGLGCGGSQLDQSEGCG